MTTATKLLTAAEFYLLPSTEMRQELVRGEVVETMPPNAEHGKIASRLDRRLGNWSDEAGTGEVGIEAGFVLARDPYTMRSPDVYFVRADHIPETGSPRTFWELAPDLAVEVISPSESAEDILAKIHEYLAAGTRLVWAVYPVRRAIVAHTPDGLARTFNADDMLTAPDFLPGFSCRVGDLFA